MKDRGLFHVWTMVSQDGARCTWVCECGYVKTTFDGRG